MRSLAICCVYDVQQLSESLDEFGGKWELNPGDGAFYGPKVSFIISLQFYCLLHFTCIFVHWKQDVESCLVLCTRYSICHKHLHAIVTAEFVCSAF